MCLWDKFGFQEVGHRGRFFIEDSELYSHTPPLINHSSVGCMFQALGKGQLCLGIDFSAVKVCHSTRVVCHSEFLKSVFHTTKLNVKAQSFSNAVSDNESLNLFSIS